MYLLSSCVCYENRPVELDSRAVFLTMTDRIEAP